MSGRKRDDGGKSGFSDLFGDDPHTRRITSKGRNKPGPTPGHRRPPDVPVAPRAEEADAETEHLFRGEVPTREFHELRMGRTLPETRIDLHGLDRAQAQHRLRKAFGTAGALGQRCVAVIHGHGRRSPTGEPTLKQALPGWLRSKPLADHVRGFAPATPRHGGPGATLVLIRLRERSKRGGLR